MPEISAGFKVYDNEPIDDRMRKGTLAGRDAIGVNYRYWTLRTAVWNDTPANNGWYELTKGHVDTNLANNLNWKKDNSSSLTEADVSAMIKLEAQLADYTNTDTEGVVANITTIAPAIDAIKNAWNGRLSDFNNLLQTLQISYDPAAIPTLTGDGQLVSKKHLEDYVANVNAKGLHPPVADITALKALDTTDPALYPDNWLISVGADSTFGFDRESTATADDIDVIAPTTGVGRWIRTNQNASFPTGTDKQILQYDAQGGLVAVNNPALLKTDSNGNTYVLPTKNPGSGPHTIALTTDIVPFNDSHLAPKTLTGLTTNLTTTVKTNLVNAINELKTELAGKGTLSPEDINTFAELNSLVADQDLATQSWVYSISGLLDNLQTTDKTSLVNAINEVKSLIGTGGTGNGESFVVTVTKLAHGYTSTQLNKPFNWYHAPAKADTAENAEFRGFLIEIPDGDTLKLVTAGEIDITGWGLTANRTYYLDPVNAGGLIAYTYAEVQALTSGFVRPVLNTLSETRGEVLRMIGYEATIPEDTGNQGSEVTDSTINGNIIVNGGEVKVFDDTQVIKEGDPRLTDSRTPKAHTHTLVQITDAGTSAKLNVPITGNAGSGEVVKGNDTRLTDSRTPKPHTHTIGEIEYLAGQLDSKANLVGGVIPKSEISLNTDDVSEGSTNKYFTNARVRVATLAGYIKALTAVPITETTTVMEAIAILEKAIEEAGSFPVGTNPQILRYDANGNVIAGDNFNVPYRASPGSGVYFTDETAGESGIIDWTESDNRFYFTAKGLSAYLDMNVDGRIAMLSDIVNYLTAAQKAAITSANSPSGSNPFATKADLESGSSGSVKILPNPSALTVGNPVNNKSALAKSDTGFNAEFVGFVIAADATNMTVAGPGSWVDISAWGLAANEEYFLTAAGGISTTKPTTGIAKAVLLTTSTSVGQVLGHPGTKAGTGGGTTEPPTVNTSDGTVLNIDMATYQPGYALVAHPTDPNILVFAQATTTQNPDGSFDYTLDANIS